jgi:hypothetical protein
MSEMAAANRDCLQRLLNVVASGHFEDMICAPAGGQVADCLVPSGSPMAVDTIRGYCWP